MRRPPKPNKRRKRPNFILGLSHPQPVTFLDCFCTRKREVTRLQGLSGHRLHGLTFSSKTPKRKETELKQQSVTAMWPAEHVINAEAGATGPLEPQEAQAVW